MADDKLLTRAEVARMFRVYPKTVTRWERSGKISAVRTLGGHRRYDRSEIERAIEAGDAISGCSVHVVTEELDAGEVLGQAEVEIEPGDTVQTLEQRVLAAEHLLYPQVLSEFVRR